MEQPKVVDALGKVACVGDFVVFAEGKRGAQEFIRGNVVSVNNKTVTIMDSTRSEVFRKSGCFVIVGE